MSGANSPNGIFQRYSPLFKSIALSVPHGGCTAGMPVESRQRSYPANSYGALSPRFGPHSDVSAGSGGYPRYSSTARFSAAGTLANDGMNPRPDSSTSRILSRGRCLLMSINDGARSRPRRLIPWQTAHVPAYTAAPLRGAPARAAGRTDSRIAATQGTSLALTYRVAESGSTAAPPHSPPPSKPGNTMLPSRLGGVKNPWRSV